MACGFLTFSSSSAVAMRVDAGRVALRPVVGERHAVTMIVDGLGDVGRMVADALDVLRAEEEVRAEVMLRGSSIM